MQFNVEMFVHHLAILSSSSQSLTRASLSSSSSNINIIARNKSGDFFGGDDSVHDRAAGAWWLLHLTSLTISDNLLGIISAWFWIYFSFHFNDILVNRVSLVNGNCPNSLWLWWIAVLMMMLRWWKCGNVEEVLRVGWGMMTALVSTRITSSLDVNVDQPENVKNCKFYETRSSNIHSYIITQTVNKRHKSVKMTPISTMRQFILVRNSVVITILSPLSSPSPRISWIIIVVLS